MTETIIIDATNLILGRLAARVAKMLLQGKRVIIVNAEKAVISGEPRRVLEKYRQLWDIKTRTNPRRGPFHYSRPDFFLKRRIRGMLPFKKPRGRSAFRRLKVYVGTPPELRNKSKIWFEEIDATKKLNCKWVSLGELLKHFGWNGKAEWK